MANAVAVSLSPISLTAPIVIGGCHRSGTTLLRVLLGRHPKVAGGAESTVFLKRVDAAAKLDRLYGLKPGTVEAWQRESRSQVEFIEKFQAAVLATEGKDVWVEKTPGNVLRFGFVRKYFPNARLIHVVRDRRDVVCSFREQRWPKPCGKAGSLDELRRSANYWAHRVATRRRFAIDRTHYTMVRYEDLIREPERVLRDLLEFLGLEWNDELLVTQGSSDEGNDDNRAWAAIDDAAVGKWRTELGADEKILCELIANSYSSSAMKMTLPGAAALHRD